METESEHTCYTKGLLRTRATLCRTFKGIRWKKLEDLQTENEKQLAKINKCYVFNLYSEDSIIKSFDLSLDISSEQAVLARYGKSKGDKPKGKTTSLNASVAAAISLFQLTCK